MRWSGRAVYLLFLLLVQVSTSSSTGNKTTIEDKLKEQQLLFGQFFDHKVAIPAPHSKINDNALYQHILKESFTDANEQKLSKLIKTVSGLATNAKTTKGGNGYDLHERYIPFRDKIDIFFVFESASIDYARILEMWKGQIIKYDIVIICADELKDMAIPAWVTDYEIYTVENLQTTLAKLQVEAQYITTISSTIDWTSNTCLRNWVNWISKKQFTYIVDNDFDVTPTSVGIPGTQSSSTFIDYLIMSTLTPAIVLHSSRKFAIQREQQRTAAVYFMNPMKPEHADVRQSVEATNSRYLSVTLPYGHILPVGTRDWLPDRKLLGAAVVMFTDRFQSCERFNDFSYVFTDWILKVIADHCRLGIKVNIHLHDQNTGGARDSSSTGTGPLPPWYDAAYDFFKKYDMPDAHKWEGDCIDKVYTGIAKKMKESLGVQYPCFGNMATEMIAWFEVWYARHFFLSTAYPIAHRSSVAPIITAKTPAGKCVVFTITCDEREMLPVWLRYYRRHFDPQDIYVLDHVTADGSTDPEVFPSDIALIPLDGNNYKMPIIYRSKVVRKYQDKFLRSGYKCVVFTDIDEIIVPDPIVHPDGLRRYLEEFLISDKDVVKVTAYELAHISYGNGSKSSQEAPIDWNKSILAQRKFYAPDKTYNKPLISKLPLQYKGGFHKLYDYKQDQTVVVDNECIMFHIRSIDQAFCLNRAKGKFNMSLDMEPDELAAGFASHWNNYEAAKKTGELCQFAIGCFLGEYRNDEVARTPVFDNTGVHPLLRLDDVWANVPL